MIRTDLYQSVISQAGTFTPGVTQGLKGAKRGSKGRKLSGSDREVSRIIATEISTEINRVRKVR